MRASAAAYAECGKHNRRAVAAPLSRVAVGGGGGWERSGDMEAGGGTPLMAASTEESAATASCAKPFV